LRRPYFLFSAFNALETGAAAGTEQGNIEEGVDGIVRLTVGRATGNPAQCRLGSHGCGLGTTLMGLVLTNCWRCDSWRLRGQRIAAGLDRSWLSLVVEETLVTA